MKHKCFSRLSISFKNVPAHKHIIIYFRKSALYMCRIMGKPDFCICENKGTDQLCSNCAADQRLCFSPYR